MAPETSAFAKSIPAPGCNKFTNNIPNKRLAKEAETNQSKAFPPTLPTDCKSPNFAIPTTKVENTSGAIII